MVRDGESDRGVGQEGGVLQAYCGSGCCGGYIDMEGAGGGIMGSGGLIIRVREEVEAGDVGKLQETEAARISWRNTPVEERTQGRIGVVDHGLW